MFDAIAGSSLNVPKKCAPWSTAIDLNFAALCIMLQDENETVLRRDMYHAIRAEMQLVLVCKKGKV